MEPALQVPSMGSELAREVAEAFRTPFKLDVDYGELERRTMGMIRR